VASALAFLDAGFAAIGTTSFGVAASGGHADGGRSTKDATLALARLLAVLPCYISVDIEDGYDNDPARVAEYVAGLGAAGINIEDRSSEKLIAPEAHAAKVAAIKHRCPDLYVNARIDTYWLGQDATVAATLERANAYVDAGADGVFLPRRVRPG
jgi:2-methylisocitrate lyase-like PEP mutase family enzyme